MNGQRKREEKRQVWNGLCCPYCKQQGLFGHSKWSCIHKGKKVPLECSHCKSLSFVPKCVGLQLALSFVVLLLVVNYTIGFLLSFLKSLEVRDPVAEFLLFAVLIASYPLMVFLSAYVWVRYIPVSPLRRAIDGVLGTESDKGEQETKNSIRIS